MTSTTVSDQLASVLPASARGDFAAREGVPACPLAAPDTLDDWRELLRFAHAQRLAVLPIGSGSKLSWTHPPRQVDLVVTTARWRGVVAYEPEDGTLTARSGTPWGQLRKAVRAGGHHVTPDVAGAREATGVTLGGVIAAGQNGWERLAYGPARHHVLGTQVLDAEGRITKSGGRLVKNVTGYDLHRLHAGAHGTLGIILEASLRLFPRPLEHAVFAVRVGGREAGLTAARRLLQPPLRPLAVCLHDLDDDGTWTLLIALAGRAERVRWETAEVRSELSTTEPHELHTGAAAERVMDDLRELERRTGGWPTLRVSALGIELAGSLAVIERALAARGLGARMLLHPGIASASIWIEGAASATIDTWVALDTDIRGAGITSVWLEAPLDARRQIDVFGTTSPGLALMRSLKQKLDPAGTFTTGRFHGRI